MTVSPRTSGWLPRRLSILLLAAASASVFAPVSADAAEQVRWPIAWKAGEVARYDSESLVREIEDGATNVRRTIDRTEIRTVEADDKGYALAWTTHDSRVEAVEGDRTMIDMLAPMLDELDRFEVVVELDRDGHYRRVRNLDAVVARIRAAMLPVFSANLQKMFDIPDPKLSKVDHDALLALARTNMETMLDDIVTPRSVEAMSSQQTKALTAFVGKPLIVGKRYRDAEPMPSPEEGIPLQASREYVLSPVEDDPTLARIRWTSTLDPRGDTKTLWLLVDELVDDEEASAGDRTRPPTGLSLSEEGVVVFDRDTGVVEMLETVEVSRYGKAHDEHDRYRMRRIGSARTWAQEEAAAKR